MRMLGSVAPYRWMLLGAGLIAIVVLVTYFPSLGIGFWTDDYLALDLVGQLSDIDYFIKFFDPRAQGFWYRPMIGMLWKIEYNLFGADPFGYHLVQVLLHLANCLLLYVLVNRITRKWRLAFTAALVYSTLPLASMTVYWPAVHDPLAGVFYLSTLVLWLDYLKSKNSVRLILTYGCFIGALLSKEISVTLLPMLFLLDRLLVKEPTTRFALLKRYALFTFVLLIYGMLEGIVSTQSVFTQKIGYALGADNLPVFSQFLSWVAFPWEWDSIPRYIWLFGILVLLLVVALTRDRRLIFLGAAGVLPVLVLAPIPSHLFNPRYLYLPLMASASAFGLLVDLLVRAL